MTGPTTMVGGARKFGLANLGFCSLPEYICNHRSFFYNNISLFFIQYLSVSLAPFHSPSLCLDAKFESHPLLFKCTIFISATRSWFQRAGTRTRRPTVVGSGTWENNSCLAHVLKAQDSWGLFSSFSEMATALFTCFISSSSSCRHILGS